MSLDTQIVLNQFRKNGSTVNIGMYKPIPASLTINASALQFKDNKTPISSKMGWLM